MSNTMKINKPEAIRYVSMHEQMYLDAMKYIKRANDYTAKGMAKHALGCMIKAYKKIDKAEKLTLGGVYSPLIDDRITASLKVLNENIELSLLRER